MGHRDANPVVRAEPVAVEPRGTDSVDVVVSAQAHGTRRWSVQIVQNYRGPDVEQTEAAGDVALALLLLPAMALGARLELATPISQRLARALPALQSQYLEWSTGLREIEVDAPRADLEHPRGAGVALLMSCGVDSFHSLLHVGRRPTHLVFVDGIDVIGQPERAAAAFENVRSVAAHHDAEAIAVHTNARSTDLGIVDFRLSVGTILAAIGLGGTGIFGTFIVSASDSAHSMSSWGTHPLLDPLWSSDAVRIAHYGTATRRIDKVRSVAANEDARQYLRVCSAKRLTTYNCGRCNKCLMTMLLLHATGALGTVATLPAELPADVIERLTWENTTQLFIARDIAEALEARGDTELAARLRGAARHPAKHQRPLPPHVRLRRRLRGAREPAPMAQLVAGADPWYDVSR